MTFGTFLYQLIIAPLEAVFEVIYYLSYSALPYPGLSIVCLSLLMNLLLLPMYKRTDAIQEEAIATERKLKHWSTHIKKTFKGDERFMILQAYYRENHYKQTDVLKGISPLLLEIPFFMAAYHFLSHLNLLDGASFGIIDNLGAPDGLLVIGAVSINVLPILMTAINAASTVIYTKGASVKTKIQLYGMALVFLILLYDSPAGLVFYWTLNNLFSLVKNIIVRTKNPMRSVAYTMSFCSAFCLLGFFSYLTWARIAVLVSLFLLLNIPTVRYLILKKHHGVAVKKERKSFWKGYPDTKIGKKIFYASAVCMTVLVGLMVPATVLYASPDEFIIKGSGVNPILYVVNSFLLAAGTFLIWGIVFYRLMKPSWQRNVEIGSAVVAAGSLVNFAFFGKHYGNMSNMLIFDQKITLTFLYAVEVVVNLAVLTGVYFLVRLIWKKKALMLRTLNLLCAAAMVITSVYHLSVSDKMIAPKLESLQNTVVNQDEKILSLSKNGKNVIVLMLDRGISGYVPYIFNEDQNLQKQFAGFTYYPNTVSFGGHTNYGLPSVMGGYEYTPVEMNKRNTELLKDKHNESLKVMPVLFSENNFRVTVCDPTYAEYGWIPDTSIYDDYPEIRAHITMGNYNGDVQSRVKNSAVTLKHNLYFYGLLRAFPVLGQSLIYTDGEYLNANASMGQGLSSMLEASGINPAYEDSVNVLKKLPALTEITADGKNTFMVMCNEATHSPTLLQMPDYEISSHVDNTLYDTELPTRTAADGSVLTMHTARQITHYHCNMDAYQKIGDWLDFLRREGVYDNTRIIIVSDHGYNVNQFESMMLDKDTFEGDNYKKQADAMKYNPVLLVKDFGENEDFTVDETFMTNADTPMLATKDLIDNPVNPFTGKKMGNFVDKSGNVIVSGSIKWDTNSNNGTTYLPDIWMTVHDDVRNKNNWEYIDESKLPK